ncbi:Acetylornithine deacetylase/Succinyl-diaminopimelate desuccinylase or related deacylase [Halanaeroarchaeum sp. HSR-CO]|uniref:M20 family metallopeptidase n=1 Tax=Halanaeroarchaeum sp. HSR-CO TaxID=2866382 RepID=UPI00217DD7E6|nr:M20 family metallopeptidase [Halanaeroarchaeum sp. HSR-CO]UWG47350.1 Acetylornithine deacetylase/Succinyl-diaminopimelate desuccinylase or related deacylase [Halanaeroarchaeum sp. HSR-CO]
MSFDPISFLERAVQTPSHEGVDEMRALLVSTLEEHGASPTIDDAGNVVASKGEGQPHVVLNTHIDTVPPHVPFERTDHEIRGRGSCDAKGPLAAILAAFLATEPSTGTLTLAVTPDEETASTGAAHLDLDADAYIVGEPTGLDVCVAARGRFQGTVTIGGTGAHAAEPSAGVNAISGAAQAIAALDSFDAEFGPAPHPRLGPPTLTPTLVEGGEATNRVPSQVTITFDRRSVPPESADRLFDLLGQHLRAHTPDTLSIDVEPEDRPTPFLEAFETDPEAPVVTALQTASGGEVRAFGAATEASYFAKDAPTVVFGPGHLQDGAGPVAHGEREYVTISAVEEAGVALEDALETLFDSE